MIRLFSGDNKFAIDQAIRASVDGFAGEVEKIDGNTLTVSQIPDLLMGATLFADKRLIIINGLAAQKDLWNQLSVWLERLNDYTELILVESSVDKRTKTYKWLQKNAEVKDFEQWRDYATGPAAVWLGQYAKSNGLTISQDLISLMIQRAVILSSQGKAVIDQQLLANTIEALRYATEPISESMLDAVLPPSAYENVFELLARSIGGKSNEIELAIEHLRHSEDGHRIAALLCSQAVNLGVLNSARRAGVSTNQVAKDLGVHPFALAQLDTIVKRLQHEDVAAIVDQIVAMDQAIKTGRLDVWTAMTTTLMKISVNSR